MVTAPETPDATPALQPATEQLKARLSPPRWQVVEARAHERAAILDEVATIGAASGTSERRTLMARCPEVPWPTYVGWKRFARQRTGQAWERQLDERVPPRPYRVSESVREVVRALRRAKTDMTCEEARRHLRAEFGEEQGEVSDSSLLRIWKAAGLGQPPGGRVGRSGTTIERLPCGGGLVLVAAAAAETGVGAELARAVMAAGKDAVLAGQATGQAATQEPAGRDEAGRLTAEYNRAVRGSAPRDPRWLSDAEKRARRDLSTLKLLKSREDTLAHKLLALGFSPLVTERRGFDGLDAPSGGWLAAMGGTAYKAATLDRALAEMALLDVGGALWEAHAQQWARLTRPWSAAEGEPRWLRFALYIDGTQDPYWTRFFAASGKVSRVGRVMPCVTRVAFMGGPGVPLWMETRAGTVSLKKELLPLLRRFEEVIGPGELGRLTIVDAEMATVPLLVTLSAREQKWFVTVLKGAVLKGAERIEEGAWLRYREHDLLREVTLRVHGKEAPADGLRVRSVEMVREGSRNPTSTFFATDAAPDELGTDEVASAYLSRWPHQEQRFRDGRNGLGLERSHGYGGAAVTHVALATAQETAQRRVQRADKAVAAATTRAESARALLEAAPKEHRTAARDNLARADADARRAGRKLQAAQDEAKRLATTPREIYVRDTTRDGIVTCLKMTALMLIEYVLKEYFASLRMEVRLFIEDYVCLPVTVRQTARTVVYQIESSPRSPKEKTERLRAACEEATRRGIVADGRRLRFEVTPAPGPDG
jgi:hypothetical protein